MRSRALSNGLFVVAIVVAVVGCRELDVSGPFPCSTAGNCPSPYRCIDQMCRLSSLDGGAGAGGHGGGAAGASGRGGSGTGGGGQGGSVGGAQAGSGGRGGSAG